MGMYKLWCLSSIPPALLCFWGLDSKQPGVSFIGVFDDSMGSTSLPLYQHYLPL